MSAAPMPRVALTVREVLWPMHMRWGDGEVRRTVDPRVEDVNIVLTVACHNLSPVGVKVDGSDFEFLVADGGRTVLHRGRGGVEDLDG